MSLNPLSWFSRCDHKWHIIRTAQCYEEGYRPGMADVPVSVQYHLQCEKCGDIKVRKA